MNSPKGFNSFIGSIWSISKGHAVTDCHACHIVMQCMELMQVMHLTDRPCVRDCHGVLWGLI